MRLTLSTRLTPSLRFLAACTFTLIVMVLGVRAAAQNAALLRPAERGHAEAIERLVREGADINVIGDLRYGDRSYRVSAVAAAALGWHADAARTILKQGETPSQHD